MSPRGAAGRIPGGICRIRFRGGSQDAQLPVQFSGAYEYNFANDYVAPEWTVNFTVKFLFPLQ
jgi:hypothetical protein